MGRIVLGLALNLALETFFLARGDVKIASLRGEATSALGALVL